MYPDVSYLLHDIIGITPDNLTAIFKTYGIFLFLGIYIASKIFEKETKRKLGFLFEEGPRKALPPNFRNNILFIVAVAGIVGSKIIDLLWCCKSISYALNKNSRGQHRHPECRRKGRNHVHGGVPIRFDTFSSLRYCVLP